MVETWKDEPKKPKRVPLSLVVNDVENGVDDDEYDYYDDYRNITFRCGRKRVIRLNHNVFLTLVLSLSYGMSESLWTENVLSAYLQGLFNDSNSSVGIVETVNGLALLLSALPVGIIADRYGRDKVIRFGSGLLIFTAVAHAASMYWAGDGDGFSTRQTSIAMALMVINMACWGVGSGIADGPVEALYADSTPAGDRARYFNYKFVLEVLAQSLGPLVALFIFYSQGDEWSSFTLQIIIYIGLLMEVTNASIMILFDDSKALDEANSSSSSSDEDSVDESDEDDEKSLSPENKLLKEVTSKVLATTASTKYKDTPQDKSGAPLSNSESNSASTQIVKRQDRSIVASNRRFNQQEQYRHETYYCAKYSTIAAMRKWIPYILLASELIDSVGGGMTGKFFALYLKDDVGMSPTQVQSLYVAIPLLTALCSSLATRAAKKWGRIQMTLAFQLSSIAIFYMFILMEGYLINHKGLLSIMFILMEALGEATYPLTESTLMDVVPKNQRATWMSLDSVSEFGWAGSAFIGGYIADKHGYKATFFITANLELFAALLLVLLLPLVPVKEGNLRKWRNEEEFERIRATNGRTYDDYSWKKLPQDVRDAALFLGYTQSMWDDEKEPPVCNKYWKRLTPQQQEAATVLGYTCEMWDQEDGDE